MPVGLDRAGEVVRGLDGRFALLVAACVALLLTLQAVERSIDGAWPHQRRSARLAPGARAVQGVWWWVALLLLPGMLLGILNLAVLVWRDLPETQAQQLGGVFVGLVWLLFVLVSFDVLGMGRFMAQVGPAGPAAMLILLVAGDLLLLVALLEILPGLDEVRRALPLVGG